MTASPIYAGAQVWPVIHLKDTEQALRNAQLAARAHCPGVFVISMEGDDKAAVAAALAVKQQHPGLKVGINLLATTALHALNVSLGEGLDATWTDKPGVTSTRVTQDAKDISQVLQARPDHLFFGSVAFKYQPAEPQPGVAAVAAASLGMIPTTSGAATGEPPSPAKLAAMRQALGHRTQLAVASGITPDNAFELCTFVSHVLVSTGISSSFYEFDEHLLGRLVDQLRAI